MLATTPTAAILEAGRQSRFGIPFPRKVCTKPTSAITTVQPSGLGGTSRSLSTRSTPIGQLYPGSDLADLSANLVASEVFVGVTGILYWPSLSGSGARLYRGEGATLGGGLAPLSI